MSDSDKKNIVTSITCVVDKTYKIARFIMSNLLLICLCLISLLSSILCFHHTSIIMTKQMNNLNNYNNIHNFKYNTKASKTTTTSIQMNIFNDAFRFFTNMNKQASAKHILIKGPQTQAIEKLKILKDELNASKDINLAFSELASKVSECPSASRGGYLGTFQPGIMVKEFDQVVFTEEVGKVHGPIETQFGYHLILITRRSEKGDKNDNNKKE